MRVELEKHVIDLYKKLLSYQQSSVCSYYRNRATAFLRDLTKLDDWDGNLRHIEAAETLVRQDADQYNTQQIKSRFQDLVSAARTREMRLHDIYAAILDQTRQQQMMRADEEVKKCLKDLHLTDPDDDKRRIEQTKGGLLEDSYRWILDNGSFREWRDDPKSRILWVKGDPGKGKTMLLIGIINHLQQLQQQQQQKPPSHSFDADIDLLSYFFCQATDARINSATAVLRGLIYLLIAQQPSLMVHVQKKYDPAGKALFEDANTWVALSGILANMLRDPCLRSACLIIDALDECISDLPQLLEFIVQNSSAPARARWIVSSRNWPEIEERLQFAERKVRLSLELNAASVAHAVDAYIQEKVRWLAQLKSYDKKTRDAVQRHLSSNSNDTFLWVALACQRLENTPRWNTLAMLSEFPPGLDSLYGRMLDYACKLEDVGSPSLYKQILAVVATVSRPVSLQELCCLIERLEGMSDDVQSLEEIIGLCGSFLTVRKGTIYFVHQSAKDYLVKDGYPMIFPVPFTLEAVHGSIFSRSLYAMSATLRKNIYTLPHPGFPINDIRAPDPDPLAAVRYACLHWVDHICESNIKDRFPKLPIDVSDTETVSRFLRDKYLYWLEALSLLKSISQGVLSIRKLEAFLKSLLGVGTVSRCGI